MNAPTRRTAKQTDSALFAHLANTPGVEDQVLLLSDGTACGTLRLAQRDGRMHVIDISVHPEHGRKGIATCILRDLQREARARSLPLVATVPHGDHAVRLFTRHGFQTEAVSEQGTTFHWRAPQSEAETRAYADTILAFLEKIGLLVHRVDVPYTSFLPGIQLVANGMSVDLDRLLYAGDLLHEAGHLAALFPKDRAVAEPTPCEGDESLAMVWSYAAARHLGIPSHIVFHECGYRGNAAMLRENFDAGNYIGLPLFAWRGFTTPAAPNSPSIYPRVNMWLAEGENTHAAN